MTDQPAEPLDVDQVLGLDHCWSCNEAELYDPTTGLCARCERAALPYIVPEARRRPTR